MSGSSAKTHVMHIFFMFAGRAVRLARAVQQLENAEECVRDWQRAVVIGCDLAPVMTGGELATLVECRFCLAKSLDQVGDASRARSILEANLKTLDNVRITNPTAALRYPGAAIQPKLDQFIRLEDIDDLGADDWADRVTRFLSSIPGTGRSIRAGNLSSYIGSHHSLVASAAAATPSRQAR